jgi:hypothetical protein
VAADIVVMLRPVLASILVTALAASCGPSQRTLDREAKEERALEIVAEYDDRDEAAKACEDELKPGFFDSYCSKAVMAQFGEVKEPKEKPGRFIEGLTAADITINMEETFGFECGGMEEMRSRVRYHCQSPEDPASYVEVFGEGPTEIENVAAFSSSFAEDLLSYVATLPYKDSQPARVKRWVLANLDESEAHMTVGTARFSMFDGQLLEIDAIDSRFGTH